MDIGTVRCRRFPSTAPPSWMKMHSHTQVQVPDTFLTQPETQGMENRKLIKKIPALQCRLECDPGYVAQKTPLITCVNGEYAKGCHYLKDRVQFFLFSVEFNFKHLSIFSSFFYWVITEKFSNGSIYMSRVTVY